VALEHLNAQNGFSSWKTIKHGVPQGLVLGPLLCNIYINDFSIQINKISDIIMFADDTSVVMSSNNCTDVNQVCACVRSHIAKWIQANQLVLNVEKNQYGKIYTHQIFALSPTVNI
jgi:hypothetical protein